MSEHAEKKARWWWPTRKRVVLAAVASSLGIVGWWGFDCVNETISGAYAQWWVADMVIEYMEWNEGSWPCDWDDLKEPYEICAGQSVAVWSFEELRGRVAIDFAVDPAKLSTVERENGEAPFRVIYLRNGKRNHWVGNEPNLMILQYLRERAQRPASYKAPARPDRAERTSRQALLELGAQFEIDDAGHVISVNTGFVTGHPRFSDAAMKHLKPLKKLRELQLANSNITDVGLEQIKELTNLEALNLYGTKVTDSGLRHLQGMEKLESLVLAHDNFSDAGLRYLRHLRGLRVLNLNGARITDAGLVHLYELENLQVVLLGDTQVTTEGVRQFRAAFPKCDIYHE